MKKFLLCAVASLMVVSSAFADIDDRTLVTFHQSDNLVTLGGPAEYGNPWEVLIASSGGNQTALTGNGTITLDNAKVPSLPSGYYTVLLDMNVTGWNNGNAVGIQLGGTGLTELGNENPGAMHYFYPSSNPGAADPVNDMQIAGPDMGPGSDFMRTEGGVPITFESNGLPLPTGSKPDGPHNDMNSFAQQVYLAPGNEVELTIYDSWGNAGTTGYLRAYSLEFIEAAPIPEPASMVLLSLGAAALVVVRRKRA